MEADIAGRRKELRRELRNELDRVLKAYYDGLMRVPPAPTFVERLENIITQDAQSAPPLHR
jgi:hypothetical protein